MNKLQLCEYYLLATWTLQLPQCIIEFEMRRDDSASL